MAPAFVDLPAEIRLLIYGYLLLTVTKTTRIWFSGEPHASLYDFSPAAVRKGLHPAILRVNKKIHQESSHFLYTQNRFCPSSHLIQNNETSRLFRQMPQHAALIRHFGITFPWVLDSESERERFSNSMDTVRRYCPNLTTVELFIDDLWPSVHMSNAQTLDFLDGVLRKMENLQGIIVTDCNPAQLRRVEDWRTETAAWSERGWKVQFSRRTNWLYSLVLDRDEGRGLGWTRWRNRIKRNCRLFILDIRDIILMGICCCYYCCYQVMG